MGFCVSAGEGIFFLKKKYGYEVEYGIGGSGMCMGVWECRNVK